MKIEELAFKNIEELEPEDELILYDIIDFLQKDRKQWINQFTKSHNDYVELQQENATKNSKMLQLENEVGQLKGVIDEASKKINDKLTELNLRYGIDNEFREEYDDLLEILDKAKERKKE